jgi:hypothetical protein
MPAIDVRDGSRDSYPAEPALVRVDARRPVRLARVERVASVAASEKRAKIQTR